jgi:hypothetical protein
MAAFRRYRRAVQVRLDLDGDLSLLPDMARERASLRRVFCDLSR